MTPAKKPTRRTPKPSLEERRRIAADLIERLVASTKPKPQVQP